jgi:hypothetical protein
MSEITPDLADKIREKLCGSEKAKTTSGHDVYAIRYAGQVVGKVSLRRSSKEKGHDYIPKEINVSMHFTKEIGICHKDFDDYIDCLRSKGMIAKEPESALPAPKPPRPWDEIDWVGRQMAAEAAEGDLTEGDLDDEPPDGE